MRIRLVCLGLALFIFGLEVLVATQLAQVKFIRGSMSDFLVTPLIYFAVCACRPVAPRPLAAGVFLFACAVEAAQYVHLADVLGFPRGSLFHVLLGNSFSLMDVLMYFLGCVAALGLDTWLLRRPRAAPAMG